MSDLVGNENVGFLTSWLINYIPFSQAINKNHKFLVFSVQTNFLYEKNKDMLLRFELTSSVLRVLRFVHALQRPIETIRNFIARLAVNLSSDNRLHFRISGGIYRVRYEITRR